MNHTGNNPDRDPAPRRQTWLYVLLGATLLFYCPFICRQFLGDDWLWLFNAKRAATDFSVFFERPMYGYFRPLNLLIVFVWRLIFGNHAFLYSLVNILLHVANVYLLWKVLERMEASPKFRYAAAVFYAFYFLNAPAIEWISVGHDLWVTCLCLLVVLKSLDAAEKPSWKVFVQIWLLGYAATLIKESGFVSIGLFGAVLLVKGISPLSRKYRTFTLFWILTFGAFLIGYAATRTVAEKEIGVGSGTLVNLWYFMLYTIMPFSQRVADAMPGNVVTGFKAMKIALTIVSPIILVYFWRKGGVACRLFLLWMAAFVATIAIVRWNISLFDLYPRASVTRFVYTPAVGTAVLVGWLVSSVSERLRMLRSKAVLSAGIVLFAIANLAITYRLSAVYFEAQEISNRIIAGFDKANNALDRSDSVVVFSDYSQSTLATEGSPKHLQAILYVWFDKTKSVSVILQSDNSLPEIPAGSKATYFSWQSSRKRLELLSPP